MQLNEWKWNKLLINQITKPRMDDVDQQLPHALNLDCKHHVTEIMTWKVEKQWLELIGAPISILMSIDELMTMADVRTSRKGWNGAPFLMWCISDLIWFDFELHSGVWSGKMSLMSYWLMRAPIFEFSWLTDWLLADSSRFELHLEGFDIFWRKTPKLMSYLIDWELHFAFC